MKGYEEYVQPPSYVDAHVDVKCPGDDQLITKLRLRIQQDLNQINGVYDNQISESEQIMRSHEKKSEDAHQDRIVTINNQRYNDIAAYNREAERQIDNLISSMHNSPQKIVQSWWSTIFGI